MNSHAQFSVDVRGCKRVTLETCAVELRHEVLSKRSGLGLEEKAEVGTRLQRDVNISPVTLMSTITDVHELFKIFVSRISKTFQNKVLSFFLFVCLFVCPPPPPPPPPPPFPHLRRLHLFKVPYFIFCTISCACAALVNHCCYLASTW